MFIVLISFCWLLLLGVLCAVAFLVVVGCGLFAWLN